MAYTPEYSQWESAVLRRVAWAMDLPMTTAQSRIIDFIAEHANAHLICEACKDKAFCLECPFNHKEKKHD